MKKLVVILGIAFVIMLTGCGHTTETTIETVEEEIIEVKEVETKDEPEWVDPEFIHTLYPTVECILGTEVEPWMECYCTDEGIIVEGVEVSYDLIDFHRARCDKDGCE